MKNIMANPKARTGRPKGPAAPLKSAKQLQGLSAIGGPGPRGDQRGRRPETRQSIESHMAGREQHGFPPADRDGGLGSSHQPKFFMKKTSRTEQDKESASNKQPVDPRAHPLARSPKGSATREEIRAKTPMVSAPRQSNRPVERSGQKRPNTP